MLNWSTGRFQFNLAEIAHNDEIGISTTQLLMEGAKRIDEMSEAARMRGTGMRAETSEP